MIDLTCKCDECKQEFYGAGEGIYCSGCYDKLLDELSVAEERIKELEKELEKIQ